MTYTITIPNWHPTPINKLLGHHMVAHRRKKADRNLIGTYVRHLPKAEKKRLVILHIVLGKGQRACDPDAYWKSLLDALVHAGALKDDSRQWVELSPVQFGRGDMGCTITLEDMHG